MLLLRYSLMNISISENEKKVGNQDISDVAKNPAEVAQEKKQQLAHGEFYPQWK